MKWIKSFFFFTLTTFTCNAYAEYYFVYPAPAPTVACVSSCYVRHHYRVHHYKKKPRCYKYYKPHRVIKHYKTTCSCSCGPVCAPRCGYGCGAYVYREPMAYSYYYYNDDYRYDPDLATGDDYQSLHPDMNIDY